MNRSAGGRTHIRVARHTGVLAATGALLAGALLAGLLSARRGAPDRLRWYQVIYHLVYRLHLVVWKRPAPPAGLVALVEGPTPLPPGRALELGCGTGTDAIYLAAHGWEVTAIDMVPAALAAARRDAAKAGVSPRFVRGDVTRLSELGIGQDGDEFDLLLDFGCLHTLPEDRRPAYVTGITQVAAPRATLLLYGFHRPPKAAPMHAGLSLDEVRQRFIPAGWHLVSAEPTPAEMTGVAVPRVDERFELWRYQLQCTRTAAR